MEKEQLEARLQKVQHDHKQQALAGAIAQMSNDPVDGGDAEASMSESELRRHFASYKVRAKKIIADKAKQVDKALSQVARLEHRLASLEQINERGYDIDVTATAAPDAVETPASHSNGNTVTQTPDRHSSTTTSTPLQSRSRTSSDATHSDLGAQESLAKVEYLRNLVLKYMSSNDASTRKQMEITIGSILKFSPQDLARLRQSNSSPSQLGRLWSMFNGRK